MNILLLITVLQFTFVHFQKEWSDLPQNKHLDILVTMFDSFDLEWLTLNVDISFELDFDTFDSELLLDNEIEEPLIFNLIMTLSNLFKISEIVGKLLPVSSIKPILTSDGKL